MTIYTPNFNAALKHVFEWEGYESDDPDDKGGHTKYGISKRAHPNVDIGSLTKQQATDIYFNEYWKPSYDQLDQAVSIKLFSACVNMGSAKAHFIFQQSLNRIVGQSKLRVDGKVGPLTVGVSNGQPVYKVLAEMTASLSLYYCALARKNPSQRKFLMGWFRRAAS